MTENMVTKLQNITLRFSMRVQIKEEKATTVYLIH